MAYLILDSALDWTSCNNRRQWLNAPATGVQVVDDTDQAIDWWAGGVTSEGEVVDGGNPPHIASGFDFILWRRGANTPEAADLAMVDAYLRAEGLISGAQTILSLSMDQLQAAGVKLGANVNREEWEAVREAVAVYPAAAAPVVNVASGLTVLYYADGTRAAVRSRADWAAAPSTGLVLAAHEHPEVGWYSEGSPVVKTRTRVDAGWSLESGGVETWPLNQPRPWQTDIFGAWQDLIRDGLIASSAPLSTMTRTAFTAAGVKLWSDMDRSPWQDRFALLLADNGNLLPAWGRRVQR